MPIDQTAVEVYQHDARFRMMVDYAVSSALHDAREWLDQDDIRMRDVHAIATEAAVTALKRAFDSDAELTALRVEVEHYRKIAEKGLMLAPMPAIVTAKDSLFPAVS